MGPSRSLERASSSCDHSRAPSAQRFQHCRVAERRRERQLRGTWTQVLWLRARTRLVKSSGKAGAPTTGPSSRATASSAGCAASGAAAASSRPCA
eukprot:1690015-Pyramimonas_sp.AAC.1